jgi:hypothetical protein
MYAENEHLTERRGDTSTILDAIATRVRASQVRI